MTSSRTTTSIYIAARIRVNAEIEVYSLGGPGVAKEIPSRKMGAPDFWGRVDQAERDETRDVTGVVQPDDMEHMVLSLSPQQHIIKFNSYTSSISTGILTVHTVYFGTLKKFFFRLVNYS
jgi:hypothetical protein